MQLTGKKLLPLFFSLMISFNSYSETLICSSINTTFKNIDPILVTFRFTRNGNIFERDEVGSIYEIYFENDKYLILDNNIGLIGGTSMLYLDKQSKEFLFASLGVSSSFSNITYEGECEVVY